jgi:hypothetical protein
MNCVHCTQQIEECSCDLRTLCKNAIIDCVRVSDNPHARQDIEHALRSLNIVRPHEEFISYRENTPFVIKGGESYGADFEVQIKDAAGQMSNRRVYAKAITVPFAEHYVERHVQRLTLLREWGIRVPLVYGYAQGTIYLAYIPSQWREFTDEQRFPYLNELTRIAAILDIHGAEPLDFIHDLLLDQEGNLYYADAGSDLSELHSDDRMGTKKCALNTLIAHFGDHYLTLIRKSYRKWRKTIIRQLRRE